MCSVSSNIVPFIGNGFPKMSYSPVNGSPVRVPSTTNHNLVTMGHQQFSNGQTVEQTPCFVMIPQPSYPPCLFTENVLLDSFWCFADRNLYIYQVYMAL